MIVAYGILAISMLLACISLMPLINGIRSGKDFVFQFWPTVFHSIIALCSAQYIWGGW